MERARKDAENAAARAGLAAAAAAAASGSSAAPAPLPPRGPSSSYWTPADERRMFIEASGKLQLLSSE